MFKFINIPVFLISFIVGLIFVQLSSPYEIPVTVYPTPDNVNKIEYFHNIYQH